MACVSEIALQSGQTLLAATKGDTLHVHSFDSTGPPPPDMAPFCQLQGFTDNSFLVCRPQAVRMCRVKCFSGSCFLCEFFV